MMDIAVYPEAEIDRFIYDDNYHRSLVLSDLISPAVDAIAPLPPTFEPAVSDSYIFIPESEASDSSRRFYGKIGMEFVDSGESPPLHFRITGVCRRKTGIGSRTLFYQYY
jgi:hypothetical protein